MALTAPRPCRVVTSVCACSALYIYWGLTKVDQLTGLSEQLLFNFKSTALLPIRTLHIVGLSAS